MSGSLYPYYEQELTALRQSAREFARQYPATAGRLLLEPGRSGDPHVERLLEGVALLAGRVRHKLDDEFPELTTALLGILYPHYLAPIPSCAVLQFDPDPARVNAPGGLTLPAGTRLQTQPVGGLRCRYRTTSPATLWPITISQAEWLPPPFPRAFHPPPRTAAVLRIRFDALAGARFTDLRVDQLRLYLGADPQAVPDLYECLLNNVIGGAFRDPAAAAGEAAPIRPASLLTAGGFDAADGLLPYPPHALPGYRLLTEYFAFPQKFWFVDLAGFAAARGGRQLDVLVYLDRTTPRLEQAVDATTFRLGCAPAVNLFEQATEPIPVTHTRAEYPLVPSVAHPLGMEVHTVRSVTVTAPSAGGAVEYQPFFAVRYDRPTERRAFWHASRRASAVADDRGTDVHVALVDSDFRPDRPADGVLVAQTLCTNRDLPERLRLSGVAAAFDPELALPVTRVRCLVGPTAPLRSFGRRGFWPLVSHLSLTHLGLTEDAAATDALKGLLSLYALAEGEATDPRAAAARQAVEAIRQVGSKPVVRRLGKLTAAGFCRGRQVELLLDEEKMLGVGAYLFASVLDRFFALHATANSFTQLVVRTRPDGEPLAVWPPRAGGQPLL
ncbi:MAG: type VI secretion system baseplate subunit TssF [Gemmataceae bacterium]